MNFSLRSPRTLEAVSSVQACYLVFHPSIPSQQTEAARSSGVHGRGFWAWRGDGLVLEQQQQQAMELVMLRIQMLRSEVTQFPIISFSSVDYRQSGLRICG